MKKVEKIYDHLQVPNPSENLEKRIIAAAIQQQKAAFLPQLISVAACVLLVIAVLNQQSSQSNYMANKHLLDDVEFFDEDAFVADIS